MSYYTTKHTPANTVITANIPVNTGPTPKMSMAEYAAAENKRMHKAYGSSRQNGTPNVNTLKESQARKDKRRADLLNIMPVGRQYRAKEIAEAMGVAFCTAHGRLREAVEDGLVNRIDGPRVKGGQTIFFEIAGRDK